MKQNIEISESRYAFVCEYEGMFYSGIVKDKNELGMHMCDLNYGKVQEYSLEQLMEWKDLTNLDKKGIRRISLKTIINTVIIYNKIKRILEQNNILVACVICINVDY